jgi:phosphoglucosamine mutase
VKKLFGTDGIRGIANKPPITADFAVKIGQALAYTLKSRSHRPQIIIGKDTRLSGYMIESALATGICSMGGDVLLAGPIPTPGVAFLTKNMDADAGVVISASHNQYQDNGIKIFSNSGFKLNRNQEKKIEELVLTDKICDHLPYACDIGKASRIEDSLGRYIVFLRSTLPKHYTLEGMKIVLDCANGATYKIAPTLFREMRAEVIPINIDPDGKNINKNSGSIYPAKLKETVLLHNADIGLAFDGDGDRLIAVDENAEIINGDKIIAICANHLKNKQKLKNDTVVTSIMSNLGLLKTLNNLHINRIEASVGDRFILEKMIETDSILGGEESGHIIFLDHHTTGDGILTALQLISIMIETENPLSHLSYIMNTYPHFLNNLHIHKRKDFSRMPITSSTIKSVEHELGSNGRVLVRYSGTQPMLRIMVEGPTRQLAKKYVFRIAQQARKELQ